MPQPPSQPYPKLPPLPKGTHLCKRPLPTRPPPPLSHRTRHIPVSATASFMSLVRRAQKHLVRTEMRERGPAMTRSAAIGDKSRKGKEGGIPTAVFMGTGRAVEKTLALAGWFGDADGGRAYQVDIRTRTVATVDDVEANDVEKEEGQGVDVEMADAKDKTEVKEIQDSRVRRLSCLQVTVQMRAV